MPRPRFSIVASKTASQHGPSRRRCHRIFALLSEYLDGKLTAREAREIKSHLCDCVPCQAFLDDLQRSVELCRRLRCPAMDSRRARQMRKALKQALGIGR